MHTTPTRRAARTLTPFIAAGTLLLAACTTSEQSAGIKILAGALPCYNAVAASIATGTNATKALTAATVLATSPACAAVDTNTLTLIASALNTGAVVTAAPPTATTSTVAAVRAPKRP